MGTAYFFLGLVAEWKSQLVLARSLYEKSLALSREAADHVGRWLGPPQISATVYV